MTNGKSTNGSAKSGARGYQLGPGVWTRLRHHAFDADGEPIEGSEGEVGVVFGYGGLLPAVEAGLAGAGAGTRRSIELDASEAYGERNPELALEVAREEFPADVAEGDRYELEREDGSEVVGRILAVGDDVVVLDLNHPLAGQRVRFEIDVLETRAATAEELALAEAALTESESEADAAEPALISVADLLRRK